MFDEMRETIPQAPSEDPPLPPMPSLDVMPVPNGPLGVQAHARFYGAAVRSYACR
jgi:hypothetical protein